MTPIKPAVEWGREGHIAKAQLRKAVKIARTVGELTGTSNSAEQTASIVEQLSPYIRRSLEKTAGVNESSDTTWALVHELFALDLI